MFGQIFDQLRWNPADVVCCGDVGNASALSIISTAKADLKEIWMAEGRDDAEKAFDRFLAKYQAKYDKATDCLAKDRDTLLAFYDFPAEHWKHIRTGNPIESTFATVRHRTKRSKGCLNYETAKIMVFKMIEAAQKSWRKLDGQNQLPKVIEGIKFTDSIEARHDTPPLLISPSTTFDGAVKSRFHMISLCFMMEYVYSARSTDG